MMTANEIKPQPVIGVIGAGSWGTTLANLLAKKGYAVTLWAYETELVVAMRDKKENHLFLPGFQLSSNLSVTNSLEEAVVGKDLVLFVPPSQVLRQVLKTCVPHLKNDTVVVSASKGIELQTLMTMSQVFEEILPASLYSNFAVLSGPSFAKEVAQEMPTAVVAASSSPHIARVVQNFFTTDYFRVYTNSDVTGVELCGAIKNVIAIAAGISDGLGFGYNTRAALITRGLVEMSRLGIAMDALPATFSGLAGMGDLVLTCTGDLSRNRTVGVKLGEGLRLKEILDHMQMVAEGVKTTESAYYLAKKLKVEMPITEQVYRLLYEDKSPRAAVLDLMTRDLKAE